MKFFAKRALAKDLTGEIAESSAAADALIEKHLSGK
jgi:hypothetical protein